MTEKGRERLGKAIMVVGAVSTFLFLSPIFPIGPEGLLVGGACFALGGWVIAGPELRSRIRRLISLKRSERSRAVPAASIDPLLPVRVLRLAKERDGVLTLSEAVVALGIPIREVEEAFRVLVRSGSAREEYSVSRGHPVYRFPEFLPTEGVTPDH